MTFIAYTPFPRPAIALTVLRWPGWARVRGYLRNMLLAGCLSLSTVMFLYAEELQQGWLPNALQLPADMDVLNERSIGSSLRIFSFTTEHDADELLMKWAEALRLAGYTMHQTQEETLGQVIEFSGQGIINAKIAVAPMNDQGRAIIKLDATLE